MPEDWYGTLDAIVDGSLDPMPSVGEVIGLDEVPDAQSSWPADPMGRRGSSSIRMPGRAKRRGMWPGRAKRRGVKEPTVTQREDRQDIADVLLRYATGIDRRDWPSLPHRVHRGLRTRLRRDRQLAWRRRRHRFHGGRRTPTAGHTMHRLTNQVITIDGDRAEARTYVDGLIMFGDDRLRGERRRLLRRRHSCRTAAGWRIATSVASRRCA